MSDIPSIIKRLAVDAVQAGKPSTVMYGTVSKEKPVKIKLDQNITIEAEQVTVPEHLTDYEVEIEILELPETDAAGAGDVHTHGLTQVKKIKILNRLKKGQRVILQRMDGGQEYVVVDRLKTGSGGGGGCGT